MHKLIFCWMMFFAIAQGAQGQELSYKGDFDVFWTTLRDNYAYFDKKQTDWERVKKIYAPLADTVRSKQSLVMLLERVFYELYDHHASLNTNTPQSQKLVPTGAEFWAEFQKGKAVITDVRAGSMAMQKGVRAGMIVLRIDGGPVDETILPFLPKALKKPDGPAADFALRVALAGSHVSAPRLLLVDGKDSVTYMADPTAHTDEDNGYVYAKILPGNIGYIHVGNHLGDNDLIPAFDSVLNGLSQTRALILDMRGTPSGGNTTVARAIMGRFIQKEGFYQKHELTAEEKETGVKRSWVELASPRAPVYAKPMVVLCGHWTGSVSEGIVIGFDALKRATVIGTPMAGLNGAVYSFSLPYSGIGFGFPAEKIFHVDGRPRENFHPTIEVDLRRQQHGHDLVLERAVSYLKEK